MRALGLVFALILLPLVGLAAHAQSAADPLGASEKDCELSLKHLGRPQTLRQQMADDLLKPGLLFRQNSFAAFLNSYSDHVLDVGAPGFSLFRARMTFPTLSEEKRRALTTAVWNRFVSDARLAGEANDEKIASFASANGIRADQARGLYLRLKRYLDDPKLKEEVLNVIEAGIPGFLAVSPFYIETEGIAPMREITRRMWPREYPRLPSYPEVRLQRWAITVAVAGSVWATLHYGVPWDHYLFGKGYWDYSNYELVGTDLSWYKTSEAAAVLGAPLFYHSFKMLRTLLRKTVVQPYFDWRFRRAVNKNQVLAAIDQDLLITMPEPLEQQVEKTIEGLGAEARAIAQRPLDPAAPDYRAANYGDYGDATVGERNFIASSQLFALERLIDNRATLTALARELREALAAGKISKANQLEYLRTIFTAVKRRQQMLKWSLDHFNNLGAFLEETQTQVGAFLSHAESPEMRELRGQSPVIERNLLGQLQALQEQRQASLLLFQAVEKIDQRRALQYASLAKVVSTLTLLNAGGSEDSENARKADWSALADALGED